MNAAGPQEAASEGGQAFSAEAALGTLLYLGKQARRARTQADLGFILVNETHHLMPYRQAVLCLKEGGVAALSGVVTPQHTAPYVQWIERWCEAHPLDGRAVTVWDLQTQAQGDGWQDWSDWLPRWLVAVPLREEQGAADGAEGTAPATTGVLLLARETPCSPAEQGLLHEWADIWLAFYQARQPRKRFRYSWEWLQARMAQADMRTRAKIAAGVFLLLIFPVDLSVLAQGELVPLEPAIIASPLDGVVQKVLVAPNDHVKKGQPLLEFDRISLASKLQVAQQALATAQAEYRQRAQRALFDADSRSVLAVVQSQLQEKEAEFAYLQSLNERGVVLAPRDGMVLFDDPNQWMGRPVVTGERIMVVTDASQVAMEAWIAPADAVAFPDGAEMTLYLASDPLWPVQARLRYASHVAQLRPDGQFAYKVRGELTPEALQNKPRVGMKGMVKLHGQTVPLIYRLVRRPWAALRAWVGV